MSTLLASKLHPPARPPQWLHRPLLVQRLNEGLAAGRRLTLVSAPAGFGKTTCVSDWVTGLGWPVAWLSLEAADDDPGRFFTYLVAALQKVDEHLGREIEGVLQAGQLPPAAVISTTLINDSQDVERPFLLVLDDVQVIQDRLILQVLEQLVTHLPPALHLVLLTREDPALPLARIRGNSQLTELRAGDLRFTLDEAGLFLNARMGLALASADIALLEERTEGWVVGLQLAGFSLRDRANPSGFIATLSGSHRYILSYLTEEVLSRQPEDIQQFLLQTSLLERLNGDLCHAVTGRADSAALLEQLFSANLFLVSLDDAGQWYRYHHLFADLLRDLHHARYAGRAADLHQRASRWYAGAGLAGEAIQHALAAADYAEVVRLLESHAVEMLMQGYAKTVEGWLQALPPELRRQSPRADLAFAWMYLLRGAFPQALPHVDRLQALFAGSKLDAADAALRAEWLALQAMLLNGQGQPQASLALARQALDSVPELNGYVRSLIYMGLASAYQALDDYARAVEAFQQIIRHGRAAGNLTSELLGLAGLLQLALYHGRLQFAFALASQGVDRIEQSGAVPPISAALYGSLGQIYYQWHQFEQAHRYFLRTTQLSVLSGFSDAELSLSLFLARRLQMQGDLDGAAQELQKALRLMQALAPAWVREEVVAQQVRLALGQNRLAAAEQALKAEGFVAQDRFAIPALAPGQKFTSASGALYNSALRILLHQAQAKGEPANLGAGVDLADRLIAGALQGQYLPLALETLLLRAQLQAALSNPPACLADVARALELAEPEGYITLFVEEGAPIAEALAALLERNQLGAVQPGYVKSILDVFSQYGLPGAARGAEPAPSRTAAAGLMELLTDRELNVVRLMADGLKYEEIAQKLYISLNTVRSHAKSIYGKLGVNNRTKAIETARQLRLL